MPKKKKIELVESNKPKLYCGNSDTLPEQYDDFGEPFECLQKGFITFGSYFVMNRFCQTFSSIQKSLAIL